MIRLFRNIRKTMLNQGKTSKYLKYAFGEIVLVVIGILIALQINNWHANRTKSQQEAVYLKNLKRDLYQQLKTIEAQINFENSINKIATPILENYKTHQSFNVDSTFTSHIGLLTGRVTFVKNAPTYTELISSGNLDIISNDELKDEIIRYYEEIERTELIINKNNNLYTDAVLIPQVMALSEMQMIGDLGLEILKDFDKDQSTTFIDLNEPRLKEITKAQLAIP